MVDTHGNTAKKVLSTPMMVRKGASVSVDGQEVAWTALHHLVVDLVNTVYDAALKVKRP